jgi:hypothetical protein
MNSKKREYTHYNQKNKNNAPLIEVGGKRISGKKRNEQS